VYAPPPGAPNVDPNAGLPSSSRPIVGDQRDTFDLGTGGGGPPVVFGNKGSGAASSTIGERPLQVPGVHVVKRGDTLWDLCGRYYQNPWQWPKLWSYNPQISNPHWIYPGDQIRMRGGELASGLNGGGNGLGGDAARGLVNRRGLIPGNTVFLRDQGFLGDPKRDSWGEIVGAVEEQMLLSDGNHVYLILRPGVDVKPGQELTVFRSVRQPENVPGARKSTGEIVAVKGSVRIDKFDPKTRVARAEITESLDAIERGAKVGPVGRRFDVVPPTKSQANVAARVLTSIYPHVYFGENQIVFLDRGSDDGLRAGNRLFVLRKGDTWRKSLEGTARMTRDTVRIDSPENAQTETTPLNGDESKFPEELVAELRVLRTEKRSSVALVTVSRRELVPGDLAVTRQGE
jgi:hypothetical protein